MQAGVSRKQVWFIVGGVVLFLIILILLVNPRQLLAHLRNIGWTDIVLSTVFFVIGCLFLTVRLRYILFNKSGWWNTFYANSIGYLVHIAMFIPAMVGRTVTVGWITSVTVPQAYSALVVERLLDMIMRVLVIVVAITVFSTGTDPVSSVLGNVIVLIIAFGALYWLLKHREKVVNWLVSLLTGFKGISETQVRDTASDLLEGLNAVGSTRRLVVSLLLSCIAWAAFFVFQFLVIDALLVPFSTNYKLLVAAAVLVIMPPSVNVMLIVYQVVLIVSLAALQLTDTTTAMAYSIALYLVMLFCWAILGGWSYFQTDMQFSQLVEQIKQYTGKGATTEEAI